MTRVLILGCVKTKRRLGQHAKVPARTLYTSLLWQERVRYAELAGCPWYILSAGFGLIEPDKPIPWYDKTVADRRPNELYASALCAGFRLARWHGDNGRTRIEPERLAGVVVEMHAGRAYVDWVRPVLERFGADVRTPLRGLGIGQQHQWYTSGQLALTIDEGSAA